MPKLRIYILTLGQNLRYYQYGILDNARPDQASIQDALD